MPTSPNSTHLATYTTTRAASCSAAPPKRKRTQQYHSTLTQCPVVLSFAAVQCVQDTTLGTAWTPSSATMFFHLLPFTYNPDQL